MNRFVDKGVLVTGASRGLGRAIAVAFGREGAHVGIAYRSQDEAAQQTLELVREAGGTAALHRVDVRDRDATRAVVAAFEEQRAIDVLVNNAAVVRDSYFVMLSRDGWDDTLATNLTGTYHACRSVLPGMIARGRGAIVNVSSVAGIRASPGQAAYGASKAGILALTRTLAAEIVGKGVRVNAVVPGLLDTGMGARLDRRKVEEHVARIPLKRLGTGAEVANAVLFLASDDASYVVGQAITVDGGLSL